MTTTSTILLGCAVLSLIRTWRIWRELKRQRADARLASFDGRLVRL
jgi:hypothetical protein